MSEANLEGLLKLFEFDKKRELERYCRSTVISKSDFANLVLACEMSGVPFLHQISYRDIVPEHLHLSDIDHKALADNGVGPLGPEAAKAVRKMAQIFEERRYLVGHMFHNPDRSRWHFFCFDQRDLEERRPNHWKEGSHVHFMNWLWPNQDAQTVWSGFVTGNYKPGSSIHLRFTHEREACENESGGPSA
ncbi:MAG TPA: hypothetical protein VN976_13455 [Verrucomicrobiae bacterium]|nr:hypothetical protein [Verrucomicrobiae bacterium]